MFAQHLEKLAAWATEGREEEILQARRAYFERIGEAHEEDRSFEARMSAFMEHFLFDRPLDGAGRPPVRVYLETRGDDLAPEEREALEALSRSVYGAFEVTKLGTRLGLRVREVLSRTEYDILERRELVALAKGDILNARVIPWKGAHVFSGSFIYHPREATKVVLREAKRRAKSDLDTTPSDFAAELARMALKLERYRNVSVENIYKFG